VAELGRMLRLDARRTALFVAIPVLVLLGVAAAWPTLLPGVAYWDNTVVALMTSVRLLGPAAAGLGAWMALREHRLDYLRGLTPRSPAVGPLLDLLLLTAVTLTAYGLLGAIILTQTALGEDAGRLHPLGMSAGAAALALHVVAGHLIGRLIGYGISGRGLRTAAPTALVTAALTWLWSGLRTSGSWWSLLPPADIDRVGLYAGVRPGLFAGQTVWCLGLIAAMVLGYVWFLDRRASLVIPIIAAFAVTAIATDRIGSYDGAAAAPAPTGHVCRDWPLTVCVHPALRAALPELEAAVTPLAARLNGTPAAFTRVEQRPANEPAGVHGGIADVHLPDLAPGYQSRAVHELHSTLTNTRACTHPRRAQGVAYAALVSAWLRDDPAPDIADIVIARRFGSWDEGRRRAWLRMHYGAFRRCLLTPYDFS
jgi:hypothetical protein